MVKDDDCPKESPVALKHTVKTVLETDPLELMRNQVVNSWSLASYRAQERASGFVRKLLVDSADQFESFGDLFERGNALYQNVAQYHTSEHMFNVVSDTLMLAELAGIVDRSLLIAMVVAATYHDVGNGVCPSDVTGSDENDAIEFLLEDIALQKNGSYGPLGPNAILRNLDGSQVLCATACILGTVMRDRYCEGVEVAGRDYFHGTVLALKNFKEHLGITSEEMSRFSDMVGISVGDGFDIEVLLAESVESQPVTIVKNADIASSLRRDYLFKNHITNRYEDRSRPHVKGILSPRTYSDMFVKFLKGEFSSSKSGSVALQRARLGHPFIGHPRNVCDSRGRDKVESLGALMFADMVQSWSLMLDRHEAVIGALHCLSEQGVAVPTCTVGELRSEIRSLGVDLSSYSLLNDESELVRTCPGVETQSFAHIDPDVLNRIFVP
jgi:hypothetical protein